MIKKIFTYLLIFILQFYCAISIILTPYNNWKYAKEQGFVKWLILGQIEPTIDSFSWPYHFYKGFRDKQESGAQNTDRVDSDEFTSSKDIKEMWWYPKYSEFVLLVKKEGVIRCTHKPNPMHEFTFYYTFLQENEGITLIIELPLGSIGYDDDNGTFVSINDPGLYKQYLRDIDLDGIPDHFKVNSEVPDISKKSSTTKDNYIIMDSNNEWLFYYYMWSNAVGFSINNFIE